ncbi:MAG: L-threonylcarbamoyladenylate synthase [Cyanobacteria bacterium]|nr:L-threonylcarbamoyladenylate synthase [Cyanobacteriota bacterium]
MILKVPQDLKTIVEILLAEKIMALPTETVYGLAGLASSETAIRQIYSIKNRPSINPLISHYANIEEIKKDVEVNTLAQLSYFNISPGPLTLVLNRKSGSRISELASAGLKTAAVRIPNHKICLEVLNAIQAPIVAPSANPSGRLSPISAANVVKMFGTKLDYILDGGRCEVGIESTVVEVSEEELTVLRYGAITVEDLLTIVPEVKIPGNDESIKSPGMLLKHYSPTCPIRFGLETHKEGEALLAFGDISKLKHDFKLVKNLSERANLEEAATNLFKMIHELEEAGVSGISVMNIPQTGIGRSINDRLSRAVNAHHYSE